MNDKISLRGDNCAECPRYKASTDEELSAVAELWYKIGWSHYILSNEEIACKGCSAHKKCTYGLIKCSQLRGIKKCSQCQLFPCSKINDMFEKSAEYKQKCKEVCSEQEFAVLEKAFFNKEKNLKEIRYLN